MDTVMCYIEDSCIRYVQTCSRMTGLTCGRHFFQKEEDLIFSIAEKTDNLVNFVKYFDIFEMRMEGFLSSYRDVLFPFSWNVICVFWS